MGIFSAPKTPAAPDPVATANAQADANAETARLNAQLNRVNQYSPLGQITYSQNGDTWNQYTDYAPDVLRAIESQNQLSADTNELARDQFGRIRENVGQEFNFDNVTPLTTDFGADRQRIEDQLYAGATRRLDSRFGQDREALETQLANQGIGLGSEAYTRAIQDFEQNRTDAYQSAQDAAVQRGLQEQQGLYGLNLSSRQQGINELQTIRNQPINEIAALLGTGQVQQAQYQPYATTNVAPTDVLGAVNMNYQGQLANASAQNQARSGLMGGIFGLGGAALGNTSLFN